MMEAKEVKITGSHSRATAIQNIRMNILNGGPGGMEIIFDCDEKKTEISIWNPIKRKWESVVLK